MDSNDFFGDEISNRFVILKQEREYYYEIILNEKT